MITIIFLILFMILIKLVINPKIDVTKEKDILLWYNWKNKRKFIIIN
jgi:hypothetical protein